MDAQPVIFVVGATGAGKSKLAINLAVELRENGHPCEIINVDIMQMFDFLPVITNKVTPTETKGVPHHCLAFLSHPEQDFKAPNFRDMALPLIETMHKQGIIPLLCGGSNYYIETLLFKALLDEIPITPTKKTDTPQQQPQEWKGFTLHTLTESSPKEELNAAFCTLENIDPLSAARVHRNNARKIRRYLEVYLQHDCKLTYSDVVSHQTAAELRYHNHVMLFVDSEPSVLNVRIDKRCQRMVENGLIEEITQFYNVHCLEKQGKDGELDCSHGVFQSIGFKEFLPYLRLETENTQTAQAQKEAVFQECLTMLQSHTHHYARQQCRWINHRFAVHDHVNLYRLDSTNAASPILQHAKDVVSTVLSLPNLVDHHEPINHLRWKQQKTEENDHQKYNCKVCEKEIVGTLDWKCHMRSKRHKMAVVRANRNANLEEFIEQKRREKRLKRETEAEKQANGEVQGEGTFVAFQEDNGLSSANHPQT